MAALRVLSLGAIKNQENLQEKEPLLSQIWRFLASKIYSLFKQIKWLGVVQGGLINASGEAVVSWRSKAGITRQIARTTPIDIVRNAKSPTSGVWQPVLTDEKHPLYTWLKRPDNQSWVRKGEDFPAFNAKLNIPVELVEWHLYEKDSKK